MSGDRDPAASSAERAPLVEFDSLAERLRVTALVLGVIALGGAVVEGVLEGLTFAVLIRWTTVLIVAFFVVAAGLTALHAYSGAGRAQQRGERLSSDDVGLVPRRDPPEEG